MVKRSDKLTSSEAAWTKAVTREMLIRPLAAASRIPAAKFARACRELNLKRSRLYELIVAYRTAPMASSLLDVVPGQVKGGRRLSDQVESIIEAAIRGTYHGVPLPSRLTGRKT
jgi:putative transposase